MEIDVKLLFLSKWNEIQKACELQYYDCSYCGTASINLRTLDCPRCRSRGYTHSKDFIKHTEKKYVCKHCGIPATYNWNTKIYSCPLCGIETERWYINSLATNFVFTDVLWYVENNPEESFKKYVLYGVRRFLSDRRKQ